MATKSRTLANDNVSITECQMGSNISILISNLNNSDQFKVYSGWDSLLKELFEEIWDCFSDTLDFQDVLHHFEFNK